MVLLRMMRFVKYQQIDLIQCNIGTHEALVEYFCGANDDHILGEMLLPYAPLPQVTAHVPAEAFNLLIQVGLKHSELLKDESHAVDLKCSEHCFVTRSQSDLRGKRQYAACSQPLCVQVLGQGCA